MTAATAFTLAHTAVSVLECAIYQTGERSPVDYTRAKVRRAAIRYLKRFPLGMTYDAIAQELRHIARHPDTRDCTLILDATSGTGSHVFGPAFRVTLPLFNRGEGAVARAEAELEQLTRRRLTVHNQVTFRAPRPRNTLTMCRQAATNTAGDVCR